MRKEYRIFAAMVVFVFLVSLAFNVNKIMSYALFNQQISEFLFGISYTVPMVVCGYVICKHAKFALEKAICIIFLWFASSALMDELLFDPFTPQIWEHLAGALIIGLLYTYERIKETRC